MPTERRYVFISYSSRNYDAALKLKELLNQHNIACWMAPGSIPAGSDYMREIPQAISGCSAFLLLLTAEAQTSKWVPKELGQAITEGKRVIPFQIDGADPIPSFGFPLHNIQRIMAHGRHEEAVRELLREVGGLAEVPRTEREPLLELTMGSAMPNDRFVGRGEELRRIEEALTNDRVAFLSGLGGMGKTELALRYGEGYRNAGRGQVYFVRFKKTFDQTVTDNIAPYIPGFKRDGLNERQIIEGAMQHLRRGDPNDLLILDNADDAEESVEQLRRVLRSLPMRILVTTRAENDTAIGIGSMETETLREIFRNHKVTIFEREMDELIAAVDGHTLTVDLMARSMTKGIRRTSAQKLLDALKKRDLASGSFTRVSSAYPGAQSQARINEHLKAVFKVADLSEEEQTHLRYATLLPEHGMDPELYLAAFDDEDIDKVSDILDTLVDRGWLMMKEYRLAIHPVICIVCLEELKPTRENCHAFVKGVWGWYDKKNYDHVRFAQLAELLTNAADTLGDPDGWYIGTAGYLWGELGESQQALKCQLRDLELSEESQADSNNLATSYNNVGSTYSNWGDHAKALEHLLKALSIREKILPSEHPSLATSYDNVGSTYFAQKDYAKALEYQQKALEIREKVLPATHPDIALSCSNVGLDHYALGDYETALQLMRRAADIAERSLPEGHPDRVNYRRWAERFEREIGEGRTSE